MGLSHFGRLRAALGATVIMAFLAGLACAETAQAPTGLTGDAGPVAGPALQPLPVLMTECEKPTERDPNTCAKWRFWGNLGTNNNQYYDAGDLTVVFRDAERIRIKRFDYREPGANLEAIYDGVFKGDRIEGTVTWYWQGRFPPEGKKGIWYAYKDDRIPNPGYKPLPVMGIPAPECRPENFAKVKDSDKQRYAYYYQNKGDSIRALCWAEASLASGSNGGRVLVAKLLSSPQPDLQPDYTRAEALFKAAAQMGNSNAVSELLAFYKRGVVPDSESKWQDEREID